MKGENLLKVNLEFGDLKALFEGEVNQVVESIIRFLTQIYPNLEVLNKIVYTPDLINLIEKLRGVAEITSEGPILLQKLGLSTKKGICLALLTTYVGNKLGKIPKSTLSSNDLSNIVGKAIKTIYNEIPKLILQKLVERTDEGEFRITILGIKQAEKIIDETKS
jgi:hypothetical protein